MNDKFELAPHPTVGATIFTPERVATPSPQPASLDAEYGELRALAEGATPGRWMRLFGERTVYDRMEDGCRGNTIVRADVAFNQQDAANLDYIAAANPAAILSILDSRAPRPAERRVG